VEQDQIWFIMQRRAENENRKERGESLVPEVDPTNPIFKNQVAATSLESLLIEKQISIYTEQINRFAGTSFCKLYLANAIQGSKNV
jgi:translation initiation factor 3 subunit H